MLLLGFCELYIIFKKMNKKTYLQPICKVITLESSSILAGSTGATAPDAGWGEARRRHGRLSIEEPELYDDEFIDE